MSTQDEQGPRRSEPERAIRWLHISDLHVGARDDAEVEQLLHEMLESLARRPAGFERVDLVFVTGDLTDQGRAPQFKRATELLQRILDELPGALLIPIPGNHDVLRPDDDAAMSYGAFDHYDEGEGSRHVKTLRRQLWGEPGRAPKPRLATHLFKPYRAWFDDFVRPSLEAHAGVTPHDSHFPGDLYLELALDEQRRLTIIGLNSSWLCYQDAEHRGRLVVDPNQLYAVRPKTDGHPRALTGPALLLVHHPHDWLSRREALDFEGHIYRPERFLACLHGHAHGHTIEDSARAGGGARHYLPAYSLFGRPTFRAHECDKPRPLGYTLGELTPAGELRAWPFRRIAKGDGTHRYEEDRGTGGAHWSERGVLVRRPFVPGAGPPPPPPESSAVNLRAYCQRVFDETGHLRLDGIAAAAKALNYPIEKLYTRLLTHDARRLDPGRAAVDLAELLPRHPRLFIEGQPGAGKTTFLKLTASVLARDWLGVPCPDGPSWRATYLGDGVARSLPVFVKFSELAQRLHDDDRSPLLNYLAELSGPDDGAASHRRAAWGQRLRQGDVTLLLDGLDEVADVRLRDRLYAQLRGYLRTYPKCQVIVSSRPIATDELLRLEFERATVAPFGAADVRAFVERWVHALYVTDTKRVEGAGAIVEAQYAADLFNAVRSKRELRRLASTPVMLTCLCVVYSHGGGLPEGRVELYRDTVRWLIDARDALRQEKGYGSIRVQEAFAVLALEMMGARSGSKRRELGFKAAAEVLADTVARNFAAGDAAAQNNAICEWLRFECEYSGVIEEVGGGRLQFKHMTFQEYLAASRLAATPNHGWWPIIRDHLENHQWRETVELFPGCLLDPNRGATEDADFLVREVHKLWADREPLVRAATITAVTGRFDPAFRCARYKLPAELAASDAKMRTEAEAIFTVAGAATIDEKQRVAAAEAIGRAGDRRIADDRFESNLIPVPGTEIRLGKYLVTVEEYARFVDDHGYTRPDLWMDDDGWRFRERDRWEGPPSWDEQLSRPNRPIIGVSWFEAMAYCRWLTVEHPHLRVRLLTEAEWVAAAAPDRRKYPWGGEPPNALRANYDKRINAPTPVGIYPAGDGEFGHCDLAGNVWEWTRDVAGKFDRERLEKWGHPRLLCGGSYWDDSAGVAAAVRVWGRSDLRGNGIGFRVAAEPASR